MMYEDNVFHDVTELAQELEAQLERHRERSESIAGIEGTAQSRDGLIYVRTNAMGALLEVKLGAGTSTLDRAWVGRTIVELAQQATRDAAAKAQVQLKAVREAQDRLIARIEQHASVDGAMLQRMTNAARRDQ